MNVPGPHWWLFDIGSGNGLVLSGNKPLTEPILTKIPDTEHCNISMWENDIYEMQIHWKLWVAMMPICHWPLEMKKLTSWVLSIFSACFLKIIQVMHQLVPDNYILPTLIDALMSTESWCVSGRTLELSCWSPTTIMSCEGHRWEVS